MLEKAFRLTLSSHNSKIGFHWRWCKPKSSYYIVFLIFFRNWYRFIKAVFQIHHLMLVVYKQVTIGNNSFSLWWISFLLFFSLNVISKIILKKQPHSKRRVQRPYSKLVFKCWKNLLKEKKLWIVNMNHIRTQSL